MANQTKVQKMDLEKYKDCCYSYAIVLNGHETNDELISAATIAFQEAYVLLLDQGFDGERLKIIFRDIAHEVKWEMNKTQQVV